MKVPCLTIFFFLGFIGLFAQGPEGKERIRLVHANSLEFDRSMGPDARRLIGDVRFEHGQATMDCDSAYLYSGRERLKAYGNVHITHNDSIHVYGDSLRYDGSERKARLRSNVRVEDPEMVLRTDTLVYNIRNSTAHYRGGGRLGSKEGKETLTSRKGVYHTEAQRMHFQNDVVLDHPDHNLYSDTLEYRTAKKTAHFHGPTVMRTSEEVIYCEGGWYHLEEDRSLLTGDPYIARGPNLIEADTLRYWREEGRGRAKGRVFLWNSEQKIRGFSGKGRFRRKDGWVRLTQNPVVVRSSDADTLYIRGDTIRADRDTIGQRRRLKIWRDVRFFRKDLQGKCDSMAYQEQDSTLRMFKDPVLWSKTDRIVGDTILLRTKEGGVRYLEIPSDPFYSSRKDSSYFDQMKGRWMKAYFNDEERIRRILIRGNGKTLHFPEGDEGELIGMNRTRSSDIDIRFKKGRMSSVRFLDEPTATLFPMDRLNQDRIQLPGFRWSEKGRAEDPGDILKGCWIEGEDRLRR